MYLRPATVKEALTALGGQPLTVLAGGTDLYAAHADPAIRADILDVSRLSELRGIRDEGEAWRIGALTTWSDLLQARLPALFAGLRSAAREVGGVQIQNAGTLGGNLCNASPAADGVPVLLALGAEVELAGAREVRRLPLASFVTGSRRTTRKSHELLTAVLIPKWEPDARSTFLKLGARKYLVISIAMVAIVLQADAEGVITRAGIAVGACSAVAKRLDALERKLRGEPLQPGIADLVSGRDLAPLTPIDDIRASAEYRLDAVLTLIRRGLRELAA